MPENKTDFNSLPKKLSIESGFSKEEVGFQNVLDINPKKKAFKSPYVIPPHPGFEKVLTPTGDTLQKLAYHQFYPEDKPDLAIELHHISLWENRVKQRKGEEKKQALKNLKFHYKRAFSLISPKYAAGWNRWSESILDMTLSGKKKKVLWGSGGCSKSSVLGLCRYTWWRVNPTGRLIIIASRVRKEATRRIIAYMTEIHAEAPPDLENILGLDEDSKTGEIAICCLKENPSAIGKKDRYIRLNRCGIVLLPLKIDGQSREIGENLIGNHPDDAIELIFDEAQELPGELLDMKLPSNVLTNSNSSIIASGNPGPVYYYRPETHDLLYRMGAGKVSLKTMKDREKAAKQTGWWSTPDTICLHLSMYDSPKDDPGEKDDYIILPSGAKELRLRFLGGMDSAKVIEATTTVGSPGWFSQVLGFPYLIIDTQSEDVFLTPSAVIPSKDYPLVWLNKEENIFILGIDPSLGSVDPATCIAVELGMMRDGRMGIDCHNGKYSLSLHKEDETQEEFVDKFIEEFYTLSTRLNIRLNHIEIEVHGTGEVFRYAVNKHVTLGKWEGDYGKGLRYAISNPSLGVTERDLFKQAGKLEPANKIVADYQTELWYAVRCAILNRQIFNIPDEALEEGYVRKMEKTVNGTKFKLEAKEDLKKRGFKSPNAFDALAIAFNRCRSFRFEYKFTERYGYKDRWGREYQSEKELERNNLQLSQVSRMLGLSIDLGELNGGVTKKKASNKTYPFFRTKSI